MDLHHFPPTPWTPQELDASTRHVNGGGDSPQGSLGGLPGLSGFNDADDKRTVEVSADPRCGGIRPYMNFHSHFSEYVGQERVGHRPSGRSGWGDPRHPAAAGRFWRRGSVRRGEARQGTRGVSGFITRPSREGCGLSPRRGAAHRATRIHLRRTRGLPRSSLADLPHPVPATCEREASLDAPGTDSLDGKERFARD